MQQNLFFLYHFAGKKASPSNYTNMGDYSRLMPTSVQIVWLPLKEPGSFFILRMRERTSCMTRATFDHQLTYFHFFVLLDRCSVFARTPESPVVNDGEFTDHLGKQTCHRVQAILLPRVSK